MTKRSSELFVEEIQQMEEVKIIDIFRKFRSKTNGRGAFSLYILINGADNVVMKFSYKTASFRLMNSKLPMIVLNKIFSWFRPDEEISPSTSIRKMSFNAYSRSNNKMNIPFDYIDQQTKFKIEAIEGERETNSVILKLTEISH